MNSSRSLLGHFRTLHEEFVAICDGNFQAALLLDYFWTIERNLDEGRSQGETFGQWRNLSVSHAGAVMISRPSKQTVRLAIKTLVQLGFIEGHSSNALNRGGYDREHANKFRLCRGAVLAAVEQYYAGQNQTALASAGQKRPALVVKNDQQRWSEMTSMAVKNDHMNQLEAVDESAAAATEPLPPFDPIQIFEAWAGRLPTKLELKQVIGLVHTHGEHSTRAAFEDAALKGGKSLKYVAAILAGDKVPAVLAAPVYVPEPEREVISLEERRAMRAQMMNGGA